MAHFGMSVSTRLALFMAVLVAWSSSGSSKIVARGRYSAGRGMHGLALRKDLPEQALRRRVPQARKQLKFNPVPLFVMLPLDTVSPSTRRLADPEGLFESLVELKRAGCEGVMGDVWWGIVEAEGPNEYDWTGYAQLIEMVASVGLKFQAVMSFHQCGGNVGDGCSIPLPEWVLEVGGANEDVFYTDDQHHRNREYLSLGADLEPLFGGRTPVDMYGDFIGAFAERFAAFIPEVVVEVQIGLGPAGELRYPSYPLAHWHFPGIGQFQCYDRYMRRDLVRAAQAAQHPELGLVWPPQNNEVGNYNYSGDHTRFFCDTGLWNTTDGEFFLKWYSDALIAHGDRVLSRAAKVLKGTGMVLAAKVAGIHWGGQTKAHGPELTAGYYNTAGRDGYLPIARMFARHKVMLDFTCLEMRNQDLPIWAKSAPEDLVVHVQNAAISAGCGFAGENALPRFDRGGFEQMLTALTRQGVKPAAFTYLRLGDALLDSGKDWFQFARFAAEMAAGRYLPAWAVTPAARQSRRPFVEEHIHVVPEKEVRLLQMLGGIFLGKMGKDAPPPMMDGEDDVVALSPTSKLQRGVQAGALAGWNGKQPSPKSTLRFPFFDANKEGGATRSEPQERRQQPPTRSLSLSPFLFATTLHQMYLQICLCRTRWDFTVGVTGLVSL